MHKIDSEYISSHDATKISLDKVTDGLLIIISNSYFFAFILIDFQLLFCSVEYSLLGFFSTWASRIIPFLDILFSTNHYPLRVGVSSWFWNKPSFLLAAAAAAKLLQSCLTLCNSIDSSPPGSPIPGIDYPGKSTGVGCHFLLQCMKVESESEVAQSCLTLCDPMDCSPPGSSAHGIFQARVLEWGAIAFSDLFFLLYD